MALDKIQLVLNETDAQIDSQWATNKQIKDLIFLRAACMQALGSAAVTAPIVAVVRVLNPVPVGGTYSQVILQASYDTIAGTAPDTVPQAVINAANLAGPGYKLYLGSTTWWYTNIESTASTTSWISFVKGPFGTNAVAVYTFK